MEPSRFPIEATYKAPDVEAILDRYFYRKIGFWLAKRFARLNVTPSVVTVLGTVCGLAAGHLYYYSDLRVNVVGMLFHVVANAFDNADGQLARLTNRVSRLGRSLDGMSDRLVWAGIYVHLCLRCLHESGSGAVWLIALAAAISHSAQEAIRDLYRNCYLFFVVSRAHMEADSVESVDQELRQLHRAQLWKQLPLRLYSAQLKLQEAFAPCLMRLRKTIFPEATPEWFSERYREANKPMIKWTNALATNPRIILLFVVLSIGRPVGFFITELTMFNLLLIYVVVRQNQICRDLVALTSSHVRS